MLATYPVEATEHNWISETLLEALRTALQALSGGTGAPAFEDAIAEPYREFFVRGGTLRELYGAFVEKCEELTSDQCDQVLNALTDQNDFPAMFSAAGRCSCIRDTLPEVHEAAKLIFKCAFDKLSVWKTPGADQTVRAVYHQIVDARLSSGSCPFCGYEPLEAADADLVTPDLDHYLAISKYPFAGVNLRNLTAMGVTCNRSYKGAQDILLDEANTRVDCLDPYGEERVTLSLEGTAILTAAGDEPNWVITFEPDAKSRNWRRIFEIEKRLKLNVLQRHYKVWIRHFVSYVQKNSMDIDSIDATRIAVIQFKNTCEFEAFPAFAILKAEFFRLIEEQLQDPINRDRMHNFLTNARQRDDR